MHVATGEAVWSADLNAYGEVLNLRGKAGDCPFRYPGQYEDVETGLYYNRFRYYDPKEGMYVSQDPIGLKGGMNFHAYVFDPTCRIDPLGLMDPWDIQFSQDSVSDVFNEGPWKGKTLQEAIEVTKLEGRLPEGLTLKVMELNGGANIITLNNRTLLVAQEAGINVNPNFVGPEGMNKLNKLLDGKMPLELGEQPVIKCKK